MMPIEINNSQTTVCFGHGDVLIFKGRRFGSECENVILLKQDSKTNPVNTLISGERFAKEFKGKTTNDIPCEVTLQFDNIDGLDALLIELQGLRMKMLKDKCDHTILKS